MVEIGTGFDLTRAYMNKVKGKEGVSLTSIFECGVVASLAWQWVEDRMAPTTAYTWDLPKSAKGIYDVQ